MDIYRDLLYYFHIVKIDFKLASLDSNPGPVFCISPELIGIRDSPVFFKLKGIKSQIYGFWC